MESPFTLSFDKFWDWLTNHFNCVIRCGTPDGAIYDDEDFHWHFTKSRDGTLLVQMIRGKRLVAELWVDPERIDYVQAVPGETDDEHPFELISETADGTVRPYYFVMAHGYDEEKPEEIGRIH